MTTATATSVMLAKRALPRALGDRPPDEIAAALAQLPAAFGQAALDNEAANLDIRKMTKPPGFYRLRVGDWRALFTRVDTGILVAAIGPRRDIYERAERMRLARMGEGMRILEVPRREQDHEGARTRATQTVRARRPAPVQQNPYSPFGDGELRRIDGVDDELLDFLRSVPPSVDIGAALAERIGDADLALLLADLWERPQHHLDAFSRGEVPSVEAIELEEAELAQRLAAEASATEVVATQTPAQLRRLLDATIEEWMVYLHPGQRSIARAEFNGPSRVRGGPGTGKTVVALHRARTLARRSPDEGRILLTTFLRTLPPVWEQLMALMDEHALERLHVTNLDQLANEIVRTTGRRLRYIEPDRRLSIAKSLLGRHGLENVLAGNEGLLLEEFDAFLTGRGTERLDDYLALRRRGGGIALGRAERERVWAAYEDYLRQLECHRATDHGLVRAQALASVRQGGGERYAGVIIDEAQDLTEVGIRLLHHLDNSPNHRGLMVVGDGQQSIYPGGFSLLSLGIDVRGRSRVLTSNWRNTWSVWTAARAVMEGESFDDLDEDVGLRPTGEEPEPLSVGDPAELHLLRSPTEELDLLAALIEERIAAGADPGDLAVLVDVRRKGDEVSRVLNRDGVPTHPLERYDGRHAEGVLIGTFKRAKGLEFKEVYVPGLAAAEWPSRWFVPPDLPPDQREERVNLQRRTLFVGMTRARDRLTLLAGGEPAQSLERARWAMHVRKY